MKRSRQAVTIAFIANLTIAVFKLVAAIFSRSASMLAEAYHSFSDTFNQVFLFIGIRQSKKKPDELHPFGYGKEQYFWSFLVAMLLFVVAGVLSVRNGYEKLFHAHPLEHIALTYAALGLGFLMDGYSFSVAYKHIRRFMKREKIKSIFQAIRHSKNSVILTVFFEDSLALVGITIAATGITLTHLTGNLVFDSIASIIIGIMLMIFAVLLAYEVKKLLIGEAMSRRKKNQIREIVNSFKEVNRVIRLNTMHMSAEEALIVIEVNFKDNLTVPKLEKVINRICAKVQEKIPKAQVIVEAEDK
ncbi:cation transporter [Candidatus Woesearchaeota archaeon]|nr:cation transporter [Candidatus Woesearchaeota archaeon]